jgi:hypothetical protein
MKTKNEGPKVVTKPNGKTGGTNALVKAVKKPTGKTGGMTPPKGAVPSKAKK